MSNSIPTLLTRNLRDVFGENDPERRRTVIEDTFSPRTPCSTRPGASTAAGMRSTG